MSKSVVDTDGFSTICCNGFGGNGTFSLCGIDGDLFGRMIEGCVGIDTVGICAGRDGCESVFGNDTVRFCDDVVSKSLVNSCGDGLFCGIEIVGIMFGDVGNIGVCGGNGGIGVSLIISFINLTTLKKRKYTLFMSTFSVSFTLTKSQLLCTSKCIPVLIPLK